MNDITRRQCVHFITNVDYIKSQRFVRAKIFGTEKKSSIEKEVC